MLILYIYRNSQMGFSIGKVFRPIEREMKKYAEVDSLELPCADYKLRSLWKNIQRVRVALRNKQYDAVHITGSEHYLVPFLFNTKVVLTVHDLGSIIQTQGFIRSLVKQILFVNTLKWANCITFISEATKKEAESRVMLKGKDVRVIPNPVDDRFTFSTTPQERKKSVVLHIGTRWNKNLHRSIQALEKLPIHLRIIGKLSKEDIEYLNRYEIDYSVACDLSDEEIMKEYQACNIVNFPSLYEGFGMPIIEGQAIGRVVVTSHLSPMQEIAGDGAILVNPIDITSLRKGYKEALRNSQPYIDRGKKNIKRFDLNYIVKKYLECYQR